MHTQSAKVFQTQRTLSFSAHDVYSAFSDPRRLTLWWGPKDFTNTFETFEFKPGGTWKFVMHGPDGQHYANESIFKELRPDECVVIRHVCAPFFTLTVSLIPQNKGVDILWVQEFDDAKVAEAIRHIVEPSNEQNLDRLEMLLRGELN